MEEEKSKKKIFTKKRLIILGIVLMVFILALGVGVFFFMKNKGNQGAMQSPPQMAGMGEDVISASGLTSAGMLEETWELDFLETALYVEESYLSTGDEVESGTAVFKVSEETLAEARKELEDKVTEASLAYRQGVIDYEADVIDARVTNETAAINKTYAQAEYNDAASKAAQTVEELEQQVEEARELVEEYTKSETEDYYRTYYKVDELYQTYYDHFTLLMEFYEKWDIAELESLYGNVSAADIGSSSSSMTGGTSAGQSSGGTGQTAGGTSQGAGAAFFNTATTVQSRTFSKMYTQVSNETVYKTSNENTWQLVSLSTDAVVNSESGTADNSENADGVSGKIVRDNVSKESTSDDSGSSIGESTGDDSGSDTEEDTGDDSGSDTEEDAGDDSGSDTEEDAGDDSGSDTEEDAGDDSGSDAEEDTGNDSEEGAGDDSGSGNDAGSTGGNGGGMPSGGASAGGDFQMPQSGSFSSGGGAGMMSQYSENEGKLSVYNAFDEMVKEEAEAYKTALENYESAKKLAAASLEQAVSNLETLEAELIQAKADYEKSLISCEADYQTTLAESEIAGTVYETTLQSLEETLTSLEDDKEEAEENLALFEEVIGDGYFYTENAGTIVMNGIRKNSYLSGESIVIAYSNPEEVTISASVDQSDIAQISVGDEVYVVVSEYGNYTGKVTEINPITQAQSRSSVTYQVTVALEGDVSTLDSNLTAYLYFGMTEEMIRQMEGGSGGSRPEGNEESSEGENSDRKGRPEGMNSEDMPEMPEGMDMENMPEMPEGMDMENMPEMPEGMDMENMPAGGKGSRPDRSAKGDSAEEANTAEGESE